MTTTKASNFELSAPTQAVLGISHGLILVSGPSVSGKTTTLNLFAEAFRKRMHQDQVVAINFEGNAFIPRQRSPISFAPFEPNAIADLTEEGIAEERKRQRAWGNGVARALTIPDPWVVVIDDMPAEFYDTALSMALTGRIVVASVRSNSAKSAEDALESYARVLEGQGDTNARWLMKSAVQASIWQELVTYPETGDTVLETYGIDVSKDSSHDKF